MHVFLKCQEHPGEDFLVLHSLASVRGVRGVASARRALKVVRCESITDSFGVERKAERTQSLGLEDLKQA